MTPATMDALQHLLRAARRLSDPGDPLGKAARARLPASSGLSPAGVELALGEHLETSASPEALAELVAGAGRAPRCHVVLAANVCVAPLRALACALATAPAVRLRPSRRDPVVAELLVEALAAEAPALDVQLTSTAAPRADDELHLYGSDESIEAMTAALPAGVVLRAHGSGLGVAVIGATAPIDRAAQRLAADLVPFDGAGCLSPRLALVAGNRSRLLDFSRALHRALSAAGERIPRGALPETLRAALSQHRLLMQAVGQVLEGEHHLVSCDPAPRALAIPPPARAIALWPAQSASLDLLLPTAHRLTIIGEAGPSRAAGQLGAAAPRARRARLGTMQKPPLDGPVDRRVNPRLTG